MKKLKIVLVINILFFAGLSANGSIELEQISDDANWFVKMDCGLFFKSAVGDVFKAQIIKNDTAKRLDEFAIVFGFNPLNDIKNITIYGQGNEREKAVLFIEAPFNKERILGLVKKNPGYKNMVYGKNIIQQWRHEDKNISHIPEGHMMFGCFYRDDLAILSSGLPALQNAIDVLEGKQKSISPDMFQGTSVLDSNVFLHVAAMDIAKLVGDEPKAAVLKQTEKIIVGIGQDSENVFASINLDAKSQEAAENISKMLEGIIAWLSLEGSEVPELATILQMIKLSIDANTININLGLKYELVKQIIESHVGKI